jgi:hypothetical protein
MPFFDSKKRFISKEQMAAIILKAREAGISSKQLAVRKNITSINDEIIEARRKKETNPIAIGISSAIASKQVTAKPRTIRDVVQASAKVNGVSEEQAKRDLAGDGVIPSASISDDAVIGASREAQFNEIQRSLTENKFKKASRELVEEQIKKERKGTVAEQPVPTGTRVNRSQLDALRKKLKRQQEITKTTKEFLNKINEEQSKSFKKQFSVSQKSNEKNMELIRKLKAQGKTITPEQEKALKAGRLFGGFDPLAKEIEEQKDTQFQIQKQAFQLRQMGFSTRLADERAKLIVLKGQRLTSQGFIR